LVFRLTSQGRVSSLGGGSWFVSPLVSPVGRRITPLRQVFVFASRFFATGRIFFADLDLRTRIPVASFFLTARFFMSSFVFLAAYQFPPVDLPVPAWDFLVPAPRCCQVLRFSAVSRSALPAGLDSARFIRFSASGAVPSPCSIFARLPGIRRSQFFYSLGRFCCPFFFYGFHFTSL
jgi:hypothetical protein